MGSQQYYQIFEDSYGRITNGNNSNVSGIPTAPTVNKGVHPPSPIGTTLPAYTQHPGNYDGLGNYNPMSPVTNTANMRVMGATSNHPGDAWGSNYPGSELDFPPTATGVPPLTSYNPGNQTTRYSPQQSDSISVLNNYNTGNHGTTDFYNLSQQGNIASAPSGAVATSNMEMMPSSIVFSGNNGSNVPYDQSMMLPTTLNEGNRFGSNCSPASGVNDTAQTHLQQQLHYNGNIALKVEPNTTLDNNSSNNMMLLQSSTNSSTALTCNTINSSSSTSSAIIPTSELVSTTSVAGSIPSATNPNTFFQPSPNYLGQSSPASAISPSSAMNGGGLGNYYSSHPPPASSTSPPSSLHSEFEDDAMGNSVDMMGPSTSISTSTGKRKTGGVSKAATSTTSKTFSCLLSACLFYTSKYIFKNGYQNEYLYVFFQMVQVLEEANEEKLLIKKQILESKLIKTRSVEVQTIQGKEFEFEISMMLLLSLEGYA